jgi:hypothetical protein
MIGFVSMPSGDRPMPTMFGALFTASIIPTQFRSEKANYNEDENI